MNASDLQWRGKIQCLSKRFFLFPPSLSFPRDNLRAKVSPSALARPRPFSDPRHLRVSGNGICRWRLRARMLPEGVIRLLSFWLLTSGRVDCLLR